MSLPYDPATLTRENKPFYISATDKEIEEMLAFVGCASLHDLYRHIPESFKFDKEIELPLRLEYNVLQKHLEEIASRNKTYLHFAGHGLPVYKPPDIVNELFTIRGLTTSYTPYQPERSQGSLATQWIYQSTLAQITGFEAINASLYDRSTAVYEGIMCARRIKKNKKTAIIFDSLYTGDKAVLTTLSKHVDLNLEFLPSVCANSGRIDLEQLKQKIEKHREDICCLVYPHVNTVGVVEDVDSITNLAHQKEILAIAVIDPMRLGQGGLKPPTDFGLNGADIIIGEGQHLALTANFGGPGLGIFGIRFNEKNTANIRATAGRFVGQAVDQAGRSCKVIVLSTREQHIRREKANSNICSNQAYLATIAGAAVLARGEEGFKNAVELGQKLLKKALNRLLVLEGVELAFPNGELFNEVTLKLSKKVKEVLAEAEKVDLVPGVDVSGEINALGHAGDFLSLAFSDIHTEEDVDRLCDWFDSVFQKKTPPLQAKILPSLPDHYLRKSKIGLSTWSEADLSAYYRELSDQNVSPDEACYPLGSCTMKYNPYINDYAASLAGFALSHPEQSLTICQGSLEIIYKNQEYFKAITGLPAVTTQPVAGAQGELVGLKLFQDYHQANGQNRDIILIPHSAHGTNPATAAVAGFLSQKKDKHAGIITVKANQLGEIDIEDIREKVNSHRERIAGIMVTNPNTSGIFETQFSLIADLIHSVGGLVYMDGANMNAIAGWIDLNKLGVDAVHNNTHKTWSIPHGGGGPGDAFVAVSDKLIDFLPGNQVIRQNGKYVLSTPTKSIGSVHRHFGNFAHKVRCYTYLMALGKEGVKKMSAVAVLSARYLYERLKEHYPVLPTSSQNNPRMHEFIITLSEKQMSAIENVGVPKAQIIPRVGKLFLDFGFHAPTVAFPEIHGLMIEPTESYTKAELDRFADAIIEMKRLMEEHPEVLLTVPHFTPIDRVDEVQANRNLVLSEKITNFPPVLKNRVEQSELLKMNFSVLKEKILQAHRQS